MSRKSLMLTALGGGCSVVIHGVQLRGLPRQPEGSPGPNVMTAGGSTSIGGCAGLPDVPDLLRPVPSVKGQYLTPGIKCPEEYLVTKEFRFVPENSQPYDGGSSFPPHPHNSPHVLIAETVPPRRSAEKVPLRPEEHPYYHANGSTTQSNDGVTSEWKDGNPSGLSSSSCTTKPAQQGGPPTHRRLLFRQCKPEELQKKYLPQTTRPLIKNEGNADPSYSVTPASSSSSRVINDDPPSSPPGSGSSISSLHASYPPPSSTSSISSGSSSGLSTTTCVLRGKEKGTASAALHGEKAPVVGTIQGASHPYLDGGSHPHVAGEERRREPSPCSHDDEKGGLSTTAKAASSGANFTKEEQQHVSSSTGEKPPCDDGQSEEDADNVTGTTGSCGNAIDDTITSTNDLSDATFLSSSSGGAMQSDGSSVSSPGKPSVPRNILSQKVEGEMEPKCIYGRNCVFTIPISIVDHYYEILGVDRTATWGGIRAAYKREAMRLHPDKNSDNPKEAEKEFKVLNEAYKELESSLCPTKG